MLGTFQHSHLRIEVDAECDRLKACFTDPKLLKKWLTFQRFPADLPETLAVGNQFLSLAGGAVPVSHEVELLEGNRIRFTLSQGIDGFHEWAWGDGWVQSRIEGVSWLPINVGQSLSLLCLKHFLSEPTEA
jgi:hypothetical protein